MKQARILVLRGGAIGDFILTLPALQALRERWPGGWIELIGYPHVARLAEAAGIVDRVQSLDRANMARLFALRFALSEEQVEFLRSFDVIVNYLHDPEGIVAGHLALIRGPLILNASPIVRTLHAADHFLQPLESLAIYERGRIPALKLRDTRPPSPVFAIHPGSGSPGKNWAASRFLEIARRIEAAIPGKLVLLFGEADEESSRLFAKELPQTNRWQALDLLELANRLAGATHYLGNDSGISHLAAALGLDCTVLFGPTNPEQWAPRGRAVTVVRARDGVLDQLSVDDVWQIVAPR